MELILFINLRYSKGLPDKSFRIEFLVTKIFIPSIDISRSCTLIWKSFRDDALSSGIRISAKTTNELIRKMETVSSVNERILGNLQMTKNITKSRMKSEIPSSFNLYSPILIDGISIPSIVSHSSTKSGLVDVTTLLFFKSNTQYGNSYAELTPEGIMTNLFVSGCRLIYPAGLPFRLMFITHQKFIYFKNSIINFFYGIFLNVVE